MRSELLKLVRSLTVDLQLARVKGDDAEIKRLEIELSYTQRELELGFYPEKSVATCIRSAMRTEEK